MSRVDTATVTAIELETQIPRANATQHSTANVSTTDSDAILQASRLADSTVPDGGYGWVVIFGCAVVAFWFVGTSYSWGVMQAALVEQGLSSASTLSFVGSVTTAFISVLAIVNSRVVRALGARATVMIGIGLVGIGEALAGFATTSVGGLFVTAGGVMGVGMSLCFITISVTPAQYFSKKRGLANGIVFAGGGLGGAITSFAIDGLIHRVGPAWTYRVIGLVTLATGLPAAYLIKERSPIRSATFIEWRLFLDHRFTTIFLAGAIGTFPLLVPPFFLPLYALSLNLSSSTGAGLVAGFNFSSAIGRIACGSLCDILGPLNTLFLALSLCGLSMIALWPVSDTLAPLVVFVVVNGASNGGFFATMPTVVGNVFGSARVAVAMGMIVTGWAGGYLMVYPSFSSLDQSKPKARLLVNDFISKGSPDCWILTRRIWRRARRPASIPPGNLLRWIYGAGVGRAGGDG
ncbi:MFS general substrate transporter [Lepidopterella palustris CBS 459.81]|uniref:MFS general substrate transporter n=1 Tax=Lepidopterella palustris CBS 459.81 TaxID=1314670 RepID=A0A8E2E295_9PEZI|nr:MFS general substrate transporter [Lepidopterella palustris CBS 459.81]